MSSPFVVSVPSGLRPPRIPDPPVPPPAPRQGRQATPRIGSRVLGALAPYAQDADVTDLFVNGGRGLWIERGDGARREGGWSLGEGEVRSLAVALISAGGRHVDESSPCVDVRLAHGIRVHVVLSPIATDGTLISVRLPRQGGWTVDELSTAGMFDRETAATLRRIVDGRRNILISGAGGAGKTTLLAALLSCAPAQERIVAIEDVAELQPAHPHFVGMQTRQPNLEGAGGVGLERLVREALRMRPDRLVLGEVRGSELRELLSALNTGHDGGAGTVHANSLEDVPARLEALGALAGMSAEAVARQAVSALHVVVHLERVEGRRRLAAFGRFHLAGDGRLAISTVSERPAKSAAR